ncbi:MAG: hypothetical protein ABJF23_31085 [Bryobacteraceae bacterium]
MKIPAVLALALSMAGCVGIQDAYAPPEQRKPLSVEDPSPLKAFIHMNDPSAPSHFIRDIGQELQGATWRWTQQRPTMMFLLKSTKEQKFSSDFTIADLTFQQTGPVTISILINDHLLDKTTYTKSGYQHIEKEVPEAWLHSKAENIVVMEIDKLWMAPADKATFGFILTSAGFIP